MAASPYSVYTYPIVLLATEVNGVADDLVAVLREFKYEDHLVKAPMATWHFVDPDVTLVGDPRFEPDTIWTFRFGYPGDISEKVTHLVKMYEPVYDDNGAVTISVSTMGLVSELMRVRLAKNWGVVNSSDIASAIASRYGFKSKIEPSGDALHDCPYVQPGSMSDYEYLHSLAEQIDFEFFVENDTLYYRSRDSAFSEPPRLTLYWWGDTTPTLLKAFKPSVKATKPGKVKASMSDIRSGKHKFPKSTNKNVPGRKLGTSLPTQKNGADPDDAPSSSNPNAGNHQVIDSSTGEAKTAVQLDLETGQATTVQLSTSEAESAAGAHVMTPYTNEQYVNKQAHAAKKRYLDAMVNANANFIGSPSIRSKATYEVRGLASGLSGLWYFTETTHTISESHYSTDAAAKRGAYNANPRKKSQGSVDANKQKGPADGGLQGAPPPGSTIEIDLETGEQRVVTPSNSTAVPNR